MARALKQSSHRVGRTGRIPSADGGGDLAMQRQLDAAHPPPLLAFSKRQLKRRADRPAERDQKWIVRCSENRQMKCHVRGDMCRDIRSVVVKRVAEFEDAPPLSWGRPRRRHATGMRLDAAAHLIKFVGECRVDAVSRAPMQHVAVELIPTRCRENAHAGARSTFQQAFALQPLHGFPHRRAADAQFRAQCRLGRQLLARLNAAGRDARADDFGRGLTQPPETMPRCSRGFAGHGGRLDIAAVLPLAFQL